MGLAGLRSWHRLTQKRGDAIVVTCSQSPDGTLIASASKNGAIQVWDALKDRTFQLHALLPVDSPESQNHHIGSLQWSPNSHYLVWTHTTFEDEGNDHEWAIWSPLTGGPPNRIPSHPTRSRSFSIRALAFNPESDCVATAINEVVCLGASKESGSSEGSEDGQPPYGHSGHSPYGVQVCDVDAATGTPLVVLGHTSGIQDVSFSPSGRFLLSVSEDGVVRIWDTQS